MTKPDAITQNLLAAVADLHDVPSGAYNLRLNGESAGRRSTANIQIEAKQDKPGIDIHIKPGTKNESVHIPVVLSQSGLTETVYNDFYIGENADVIIVAGCGIHNAGAEKAEHDGLHRFFVGAGARVRYIEKHYGEGDGAGQRIMNPHTVAELAEGAYLEMETVQIKGVDSTIRRTDAILQAEATLVVKEKIMTHGSQLAETHFNVEMNGPSASCSLSSRSVAAGQSKQVFCSNIVGNAPCNGHSECDGIIMDEAQISAIPEISANHPDASLIHEAAIGKIAGEQILKLQTLGLTEAEAEAQIISGFLK
ncbi:MAG: SufD family Fe-S cluster assembly protein [Peptococcaceae bacterium]|jgi:Fe-S cluster assembly scaffold protein SufB|nr:SufD family Fe-S cluster assembly protein [Peptococcaceae bacterium]